MLGGSIPEADVLRLQRDCLRHVCTQMPGKGPTRDPAVCASLRLPNLSLRFRVVSRVSQPSPRGGRCRPLGPLGTREAAGRFSQSPGRGHQRARRSGAPHGPAGALPSLLAELLVPVGVQRCGARCASSPDTQRTRRPVAGDTEVTSTSPSVVLLRPQTPAHARRPQAEKAKSPCPVPADCHIRGGRADPSARASLLVGTQTSNLWSMASVPPLQSQDSRVPRIWLWRPTGVRASSLCCLPIEWAS